MEWSFLLPPGWQTLKQASLAEIAADQYHQANAYIQADLAVLSPSNWMQVDYGELVREPVGVIDRICQFAGLTMDGHWRQVLARPLPLSRYTLSAPTTNKWHKNAAEIEAILSRSPGRLGANT